MNITQQENTKVTLKADLTVKDVVVGTIEATASNYNYDNLSINVNIFNDKKKEFCDNATALLADIKTFEDTAVAKQKELLSGGEE